VANLSYDLLDMAGHDWRQPKEYRNGGRDMEIPQVVRTYVDTWSGADLDGMVGLLLSLLTERIAIRISGTQTVGLRSTI
jgi:hypothetical protein